MKASVKAPDQVRLPCREDFLLSDVLHILLPEKDIQVSDPPLLCKAQNLLLRALQRSFQLPLRGIRKEGPCHRQVREVPKLLCAPERLPGGYLEDNDKRA